MALVVVNADDFGIADGVCRSIRELLNAGAVSNTTLMLAVEDSPARMVRWGVRELLGRAGVHIQLTGGTPLSPARDVPSLVNPSTGRFLLREEIKHPDPQQVELEWTKQVEAAHDLLGGPPTHLDSHRGVSRIPECVDVFVSIAAQFGLPIRGAVGETEKTMKARDVRGTVHVIRDWTGRDLGADGLLRMVDDMAAGGAELIEVVTHPGYNDDYLRRTSSLNAAREGDHASLLELVARGWPASSDHRRVSFPELDG